MPNNLDTIIKRGYEDIMAEVEGTEERGDLRVKELVLARLIAEENYPQREAYIAAFHPSPDAKEASIDSMASRVCGRPRVKAEIDRKRNDIREKEMSKESRLGAAFDGAAVNQRIALELFAIIVSSKPDKLRVKCMEIIGKMKHVDAFVGVSSALDEAKRSAAIDGAADAGSARAKVREYLSKAIADRIGKATVEIEAAPE